MKPNEVITLVARKRDRLGTRHARRLRQAGGLPCILYGHGEAPLPLSLDHTETVKHLKRGEKVFTVRIDDVGASETVFVKDIQFDFLGDGVVHVDLTRVNLEEEVETEVRVRLVGDAKGLDEPGASMLHPNSSITVRCKVKDIVDHFDLSVEDLEVGDTLHASDVALPPGFELISDPEDVLATIQVMAEEPEAEEAEVAGEAAEPEVIGGAKEEPEEGEESKQE